MKKELAKRCLYDAIKTVNDLVCVGAGAFIGFWVGIAYTHVEVGKDSKEKKRTEPKEDEA